MPLLSLSPPTRARLRRLCDSRRILGHPTRALRAQSRQSASDAGAEVELGADPRSRGPCVFRLPQQPDKVAVVLERRANVLAGEARCRQGTRANFSEWNRPQDISIDDLADSIRGGSMPPWFYTIPHPGARLSASDKDALIRGLAATFQASPPIAGARGLNRASATRAADAAVLAPAGSYVKTIWPPAAFS
jgi:Haem-binding domain